MNDPKEFVKSLKLPPVVKSSEGYVFKSGLESASQGESESFINKNSLVSFISSVEEQNREDVLRSTLLAQLAADHKFPNDSDLDKWYDSYINVLANIGWIIEEKDFSEFHNAEGEFEMDVAVLEIIAAMVGQNHIAIINSSIQALKKLGDDDNKVKVFEKKAHGINKGTFQIGLVNEQNAAISMQIGAFIFSASENMGRVLFFKTRNDKIRLNFYSIRCTLNTDVYAEVRNQIKNKLGESVSNYVSRIEI